MKFYFTYMYMYMQMGTAIYLISIYSVIVTHVGQ